LAESYHSENEASAVTIQFYMAIEGGKQTLARFEE